MAPDRYLVAMIVRITVMHERIASCQQYHSIIITVPVTVSTPDTNELNDCDIVFDIFSTSFVIRLIISPCEWLSIYFIGRSAILSNKSSLILFTILWLSFALKIDWQRFPILLIPYNMSMIIRITESLLKCLSVITSIALLWSAGVNTEHATTIITATISPVSISFSLPKYLHNLLNVFFAFFGFSTA